MALCPYFFFQLCRYITSCERHSGDSFFSGHDACVLKECPGSAIEVVKECSAQADGLSATYIGTKDEKIFIVQVSSLCSAKGKKGGGVWVYTEPPDILSSFAGMSGIG